jgi:hypothetical protein
LVCGDKFPSTGIAAFRFSDHYIRAASCILGTYIARTLLEKSNSLAELVAFQFFDSSAWTCNNLHVFYFSIPSKSFRKGEQSGCVNALKTHEAEIRQIAARSDWQWHKGSAG